MQAKSNLPAGEEERHRLPLIASEDSFQMLSKTSPFFEYKESKCEVEKVCVCLLFSVIVYSLWSEIIRPNREQLRPTDFTLSGCETSKQLVILTDSPLLLCVLVRRQQPEAPWLSSWPRCHCAGVTVARLLWAPRYFCGLPERPPKPGPNHTHW